MISWEWWLGGSGRGLKREKIENSLQKKWAGNGAENSSRILLRSGTPLEICGNACRANVFSSHPFHLAAAMQMWGRQRWLSPGFGFCQGRYNGDRDRQELRAHLWTLCDPLWNLSWVRKEVSEPRGENWTWVGPQSTGTVSFLSDVTVYITKWGDGKPDSGGCW